jgi:WD40 repeat protein
MISRAVAPPGVAILHGAFDPTGRRISLLGDDQRLYLHDVATGTALDHPVSDAPIAAWDFTRDGELVTADEDGNVVIWSGSSPQVRWHVDERITAVAVVGERVVTAHRGSGVRVFDRKGGALLASRPPQAGSAEAVAAVLAVERGRRLVLGSTGGDTIVVDAATLDDVARVPGVFVGALDDGRWATATSDGRVRVMEGASVAVELGPGTGVSAIASGRGETSGRLAVGRRDGSVELWGLASAKREVVLAPGASPPLGPPVGLAISLDGTSLFAAYASGAVRSYAISARAALDRACALLLRLGRAQDGDLGCPGVDVPMRGAAARSRPEPP